MGQYEPNGIGEMRKKRKKYENQANVVRCTHEHITFGARTSARCEWVFRCGSFFGKCRGNANGTTLTIQRTVYAVCETLMFFYFLFLCVVFFFCADLERELDSRPRMPRHNRHNLARANETHALHEYMYIGEAGGAVVYLVWAWQLVNHDDVCTTAIRTAATISAQYTPSAFYPEQVQVPLTPVRRPGTRLRRRCSLFTYDCRLYV